MAALDTTLGALLIGTYANSLLYMVEILQVYRYYRSYPGDHVVLKGVVLLAFLIDTLSTLGNYSCVYLYTITHWGDESYVVNQYWPIPVYLITTGLSAFIVQTYLNHRYWRLTKHYIVTPILLLFSLTALGGSIATAAIIVKFPLYNERSEVTVPVTVWLVASAVSDVCIALALIVQLQRVRSQTSFKSTKSLISRLTTSAIQTGAPGATVATIALIVYLNNPDENVSVGLAFCLGRIYCLTMLNNLNSRIISNPDGSRAKSQSAADVERDAIDGLSGISTNGIHVHRMAVVHIDEQRYNGGFSDRKPTNTAGDSAVDESDSDSTKN
ncbi:hypothetical protein BT96DRAFT_921124 [Gymnopus androsaceus JB14]|uniref:DUF6534 domain-containing protein n=1 Tax=Gymnopus androsaceus JB14 TaxID=1447944 RepID=A0A6A4HHB2_9AGAR|nr:hypothetical protein BT96DRAFT_921124 [Gymnopus androsaceus JB14]